MNKNSVEESEKVNSFDRIKKQMGKLRRPRSRFSSNEIVELSPSIKLAKRLGLWTFILVILLLAYIMVANRFDFSAVTKTIININSLTIIFSVLLALVSSFIGALAFSMIEERYYERRLNYIVSLAPVDYVKTIIDDLIAYGGRYYQDYTIRIKFKRLDDFPNLLLVCRSDKYRKRLLGDRIEAKIVRINNLSSSVDNYNEDELSQIFETCEFFQRFDERSIDKDTVESKAFSELYQIEDPIIERQTKIPMKFVDGNPLHKKGKLPTSVDISNPVLLGLVAQWPMELDSFYSIILEFPCKGIDIEIDYSEVKDLIDLAVEDFLNTRVGAPISEDDTDQGIKKMSHNGWHPAKSNISLTWFKK